MKKPVFTGAAVAIITPMNADGSVNFEELGRIIDDQIANGTDAIVIILGVDPTYQHIYEGNWLNDEPYGVIHRLATNGKRKGVSDACLNWCFEQWGNIRVDTHQDNKVMQHILTKYGFQRCGIIYVKNGTERIAYQKKLIKQL